MNLGNLDRERRNDGSEKYRLLYGTYENIGCYVAFRVFKFVVWE
jgi:hypothetical protein